MHPVPPQVQSMRAAEKALRRVLEPGAENTERAYAQARERWALWCAGRGLSELPIDPAALVVHLEELSEDHAPATVRLALSALSTFDKKSKITPTNKTPQSVRSSPIVQEWLKSWSREMRDRPKRKAPSVGRAQLVAIVRGIYADRPVRGVSQKAVWLGRMRDRALILTGWLGCLRRSEIAALDPAHFVEIDKGLELHIPHSKVDQTGKGASVNIYRQQSGELCALDAWRVWQLAMRAEGFEGAAFPQILPRGNLTGRLSPQSVGEVIKRRAAAAGFAALGHSLRVGFATEAAEQRKPESDVQKHGRWRSIATVREYVERADRWKLNPTEGIT